MKVLTLNIHSHSRIHDEQAYRDMIYLFSEWTVREGIDVIALQAFREDQFLDSEVFG